MKRSTSRQTGEFLLFAFPALLPLILLVVAIFILKTPLNSLLLLLLFNAAVLLSAVLLVKKHWWISLPMLALGIYIALQKDQHIPFQPFGCYLILHYAAWGLYTYKTKQDISEQKEKILFYCGAATAVFFLYLLYHQ